MAPKNKASKGRSVPRGPGTTGWRKYGKAKIKKAVEGSGGYLSVIAKRLDCSRTTLNKYREELPELNEWIEDEGELLGDVAESKLAANIKEGNLTAIIFYLKTRQQKRGYIEKYQVDQFSPDGSMSQKGTPEEYAKKVAEATREILELYRRKDDEDEE